MNQTKIQTELVRPFLPTKDMEASKRFYQALGFEMTLDCDVVIFRAGNGGFILQRHYDENWAGNCLMQMMVDDLDSWWSQIEAMDLSGRFGVSPPKPPAMQPWGLRVAYIVDPAGALWHVAQRRPNVVCDV
jgi:predicted enzyme related to lactoylglutathione lyase